MGNTQSEQDALNQVEQDAEGQPCTGVRLYKFLRVGDGGDWKLVSANAAPKFFDQNEDAGPRAKHDWYLELDALDEAARVDDSLGYVVDLKQRRVTFSAGGDIWALRFPDEASYKAFCSKLTDCVFYNTYGVDNDAAGRDKILGQDYGGMFFNTEPEHFEDPMDDSEEPDQRSGAELASMREAKAKGTEGDDEDDAIHGIVMGAGENNFLLRGSNIDVLRNVEGGVEDADVSFCITPAKGKSFTPAKVLLTQRERRMNLLTPLDNTKVHHVDIEASKVVSTWTFQKDGVEIPIRDIVNDNKAAQLEEGSTFMGLDMNRLCRWDMRVGRGVVQESPAVHYNGGHDFSRGTNFTCMATSGDGFVAVGSTDGKVRLYNSKTLSRANTSIPGLGAPVTAIDITFDGKWVLATTARYLMVIKTTFTDDKGKDACGFTSRMGGRGTAPRLLRLKPEDAARTGSKPLSKGKFTWITEQGETERYIVANCGKFSIVWNFTRVKTSGSESLSFGGLATCMEYTMTAGKEEDVVDAAFQHHRYVPKTPGKDHAQLLQATQHGLFNLGA